jgi:hypothetical protein
LGYLLIILLLPEVAVAVVQDQAQVAVAEPVDLEQM